ncbi:pilus assembly protein PapD [Scandinavium sp. V105_16]|uniref:Pilus assembly protein PapD n=1 Tax=Scandinavium lactucae TaxID=3095028 RepID=A0AAJ2S4H2_9ENTR|nr:MULTISPECIES: pilus assembly protein PapD [unclassified Scandinavium]MDX6020843.1 pilus assembly protein PapD [Scandinavium sp. V105_16]MDX6030935.1 pilus assembly protein PapD [Scandinavium sp. V105_12]
MNNFLRFTSSATVAGLLISSSAFAAITVYPMSVKMNEHGAGQIKVISGSKQTEYVKAAIKKINNPGTPQEKEIEATKSDSQNLVITPEKFALAGGTTRITRLVNMQTPTTEQVYRIYFSPITSLDNEQAPDTTNVKNKVGVNISWGALVFVPPQKPEINFTFDAQQRRINNTGTIHIELSRIGLCPAQNSDTGCKWTPMTKKIYPQQSFTLPASFSITSPGVIKVEYHNWVEKTSAKKEFAVS